MVARVRSVLDCIDMEVAPQPDDRPPRPDAIIDKCLNHDATISIMMHALVVVRSHYPMINLQAIGARFARGMGATKQE